jgi:hypothetical protein
MTLLNVFTERGQYQCPDGQLALRRRAELGRLSDELATNILESLPDRQRSALTGR